MANHGTKAYRKAMQDMADHFFGDFLCDSCKHYHGVNTCDAFTEQIPLDIVTGEVLHTSPYKGDNGIRYEKK